VDAVLEQYLLEQEDYKLALKSDSGQVKAREITGFNIPIQALFNDPENLRVLTTILG
jgi:hypothetical protein